MEIEALDDFPVVRRPALEVVNAPYVSRVTGLSIRASREIVKRYGFRVGERNWFITTSRLEKALDELQNKGGRLDG